MRLQLPLSAAQFRRFDAPTLVYLSITFRCCWLLIQKDFLLSLLGEKEKKRERRRVEDCFVFVLQEQQQSDDQQ